MATEREVAARIGSASLLVAAVACDPLVVIGADPPSPEAGVDATVEASVVEAGADLDASVDAVLDASADVDADSGADAGADADAGLTPIPFPWSTSFENGSANADFTAPDSLCYILGGGFFQLVTSPAHTGTHSISFAVNTDTDSSDESQARCFLSGILPASAYYGAWYYLPATAVNAGNWNLIHFQGSTGPSGTPENLWDISLVSSSDGQLHLTVHDFFDATDYDAGAGIPPIPIKTWFHLQVFLQRAADSTGRFTLYQDGQIALDLTGIKTDDTAWGQFFVGSLATALTPASYTLNVDDMTVGPSL